MRLVAFAFVGIRVSLFLSRIRVFAYAHNAAWLWDVRRQTDSTHFDYVETPHAAS